MPKVTVSPRAFVMSLGWPYFCNAEPYPPGRQKEHRLIAVRPVDMLFVGVSGFQICWEHTD
jgi:hypothetical protein